MRSRSVASCSTRSTPAGRSRWGRTPSLGAYLTHWLDVRIAGEVEAGHLDESTADSYRQMIEGHILPTMLAKVRLPAVSGRRHTGLAA